MKHKKNIYSILFFIISINNYHNIFPSLNDGVTPIKRGNFALTTSQMPGPLFCFGQNIVDKNDFQLFLYTNYLNIKNNSFDEIVPGTLYGINDKCSILLYIPHLPFVKNNSLEVANLEDSVAQLEYAFYSKTNQDSMFQITGVANMSFPTGTTQPPIPTGFGTPRLFLGCTMSYFTEQWYGFTSNGAYFTTQYKDNKPGNQYLYEGGFGKNIWSNDKWIFTIMLEAFGIYTEADQMLLVQPWQQHGNIFYLGPTLWLSSKDFIVQFGFAAPVYQNFADKNYKVNYIVGAEIVWKL